MNLLPIGLLTAAVFSAGTAYSGVTLKDELIETGMTAIHYVSPANFNSFTLKKKRRQQTLDHHCKQLTQYFEKYGWEKDPCGKVKWHADMTSKNGHPLLYASFGNGRKTTLLLGGVHPDEYTPIPMAFRFARHLLANPQLYNKEDIRVIIAPLVNPDGFLRNVPTRNNANGVDPNRNLYTMDWYDKAKERWAHRRDIRHFPGYFPNSEVEAIFQADLIDRYHPDKILSIHAPLGFLDYDGPGDRKPRLFDPTEKQAKRLVYEISEKSHNYKVVDFTFYPGSLGNYAGNERRIPTITLELETTQADKVDEYWEQFLPGMLESIIYPFAKEAAKEGGSPANATRFSTSYKLLGTDTI